MYVCMCSVRIQFVTMAIKQFNSSQHFTTRHTTSLEELCVTQNSPGDHHYSRQSYADQARLGSHASPNPKQPGTLPVHFPIYPFLASTKGNTTHETHSPLIIRRH